MSEISTTTVPSNGLPVYRIALPGTRALTVLVAFDAGARNERPQENGMAHFLEHLVFKGGEKYPTYKDVNETAERLGGVLNAYTSHDLVAFHITVRAESAPGDRPALRLRRAPALRRRGARPRARSRHPGDQPRLRPAVDGRRVPDRPGRLRRAPARSHGAGAGGEPAQLHARGDRRVSRAALVGRARRRVPRRQPGPPAGRDELHERFARFPALPEPEPYEPARSSRRRRSSTSATPTSRTCA